MSLTSSLARMKQAAAVLLLAALAACAQNFNANVSRFQSQLPAPAGQTFAVVADDPADAGGIEFGQYARLVEDQMTRQGYTAAAPESAPSLAPKRPRPAPSSAAIRTSGTIRSDPGKSATGRPAARAIQTTGLPSAVTRSCAP